MEHINETPSKGAFLLKIIFQALVLASAGKKETTESDVISLSNAVMRREKKVAVAGTLKCQSLCGND